MLSSAPGVAPGLAKHPSSNLLFNFCPQGHIRAQRSLILGPCLALRVAGGDAAQRVLRVQQGHRGEALHVEPLGRVLPHPQVGPALVQKVIHDLRMRSQFQ